VTLVPKSSACSASYCLGMETCYGIYSNGIHFMNGLNFKVIWYLDKLWFKYDLFEIESLNWNIRDIICGL
jgi:hypothetical protein